MKRYLFLAMLVVLSISITLSAQNSDGKLWRKTEGHQSRKNSIMFSHSLGVETPDSYNNSMILANFNVEYDRALGYNFSVSGIGMWTRLNGGHMTDVYSIEEDFWFIGAKINYNLPVVHNWLYFRVGIGAGMGVHDITNYFMGWNFENIPKPPAGTKVKFHAIVDAYWVLRVSRTVDLRFAPLIVSPSYLIVGSKYNAPYNDATFWAYNLITIGATVRF